jgi:lantibiotic modifying enzyme
MEERIKSILSNLYSELDWNYKDKSLFSGVAGIDLFHFLYCKHFKGGELDDKFTNSMQELIIVANDIENLSFAGGKSGINWYYSFLFNNDVLELHDFRLLTNDVKMLEMAAVHYLKNDYYDPLHGGLGIARQLINVSEKKPRRLFYNKVFIELDRIFAKGNNMFRHFDISYGLLDLQKTNFGLSHGLAGILKFCLECYNKNICSDAAYEYAYKITNFLSSNMEMGNERYYFPSILDHTRSKQQPSRLAWCYADIGIGFILFQAGKIFKDIKILSLALQILRNSTSIQEQQETRVCDAGFCHGAAGIAYVYKKLWVETSELIFLTACDFWIEQTIEYSKHTDGIGGFKAYDLKASSYKTNPGLLEGSAGIGLVLLSYLTNDFSWDYCVMLNDLS